MTMTSMYLDVNTINSTVRADVIQRTFLYTQEWTWKNFNIVFAGQEVTLTTGEKTSWDKNMIQVTI